MATVERIIKNPGRNGRMIIRSADNAPMGPDNLYIEVTIGNLVTNIIVSKRDLMQAVLDVTE